MVVVVVVVGVGVVVVVEGWWGLWDSIIGEKPSYTRWRTPRAEDGTKPAPSERPKPSGVTPYPGATPEGGPDGYKASESRT